MISITVVSPWRHYGRWKSDLNNLSHRGSPLRFLGAILSYQTDSEQTYAFWTMISCPILTITGVSFSRRPRTNSKLVIGTFCGFLFWPTNFYIWWDRKKYNKRKYSDKQFWPRWSDTHIQRQIDDSVKPQPNNSKSPSSFVSLTCSNVSFHRFSIIEEC